MTESTGVRQRRPGVWEVRVALPRDAVTGKRLQLSRTVRGTREKALAARRKLLKSVAAGDHVGTPATVAELLDRWLAHIADDYSPTTVREFSNFVASRLKPALGEIQLRRLTPDTLDEYYRRLVRNEGLAPATARKAHAIMHLALAQAVRWRWLRINVADSASPPRLREKEITPPSPEAMVALLAAALEADPALGTFLALTADAGARRGELCGLRESDVDLEGEELTIRRAVVELVGGDTLLKDTKTHRARVLALAPETIALLRSHRERMVARAAAEGVDRVDDPFVFSLCIAGCHPWRPNYATKTFIRLRDGLELPHMRLHDFRHFSSTQLLAKGIDPKVIAVRHGWANAAMLLNRYGHATKARDRDAARVMGEVLHGHRDPPE